LRGPHFPSRRAAKAVTLERKGANHAAEETAAEQMEQHKRPFSEAEITALLDDAVAYAEAGVEALRRRR
jgi:hypothetical protein